MIPPTTALAGVCPSGNRIATELLSDLLEARIQLTGGRVLSRQRALELNRAMLVFEVSALGGAITAIKGALAAVGILPWSQIAWLDFREGVKRMVHPDSGEFQNPSPEEMAAEATWASESKDLMLRLKKALENAGQRGASGAPGIGGQSPR
jgi:hypothetical protein